ncbi:MAG: hypothetical protein CMH94_05470 [Oceanicaulis sp.]|nr:hypothetical protein [Oceanicaulis sp.]MAZ90676.1 hypothetical protein [Maricaulis sp.]MBI75035.1 hypothetical protein [Oceanicaulis sp.]
MIERCGTASSIFADATSAVRTWPRLSEWGQSLLLFGVFALIAAYLGQHESLFKFSLTDEWRPFIVVAVIAILVPSLAEEMVFRVLLGGRTGWLRAGIAIAAFVLWHPVQVWLGLPMAQPVFLEPAFLAIVALLGLVCTVAYRTSGAIWPPVAIHWGTVVLWKAVAAG